MKNLEDTFKATLVHKAQKDGEQDRFMVTIGGEDFPYSKGIGLRVHVKTGERYPFPLRQTIYEMERFWSFSVPVSPTFREMMECLVIDAECYEQARSLDDFAAEFGYEKPQAAIDAWNACSRASHLLRHWGVNFDDFREEV